MLKPKLAIATVAISAIILALFAVFIPSFGEQKQQRERVIFLGPDEVIASIAEVSYRDENRKPDSAHFLGEKFYLTFSIQYRNSEVEPDISYIGRADLYPFELAGDVELTHEDVTENISEYRYTVEIMAIEALSGREYILHPIEVRYSILSTGEERVIDVAPAYAFYIGQYGTAAPRPYMGPLVYSFYLRQKILAIVSALFFFAFVLVLQHYREKIELQHEGLVRDMSGMERVLNRLSLYRDNEWLRQESSDTRMREVEKITKSLAQALYDISPKQFDMEDHDKELNAVRRIFYKAYTERGSEYADVAMAAERAIDIFKKAINILHLEKKGGGR